MGMVNFNMPSLGADMDSGVITQWFIKPGDKVTKGQMVAEIETSKSNIEIESFYDGVVKKILAPVAEKVSVGSPIAVFEVEANIDTANTDTAELPKEHAHKNIIEPIKLKKVKSSSYDSKEIQLSPRAKNLVTINKINEADLKNIKPSGIIEGDDVLAWLKTSTMETPLSKVQERQQVIAKLMEKSKLTIPHFYLEKEMRLDKTLAWLQKQNEMRAIEERYISVVAFLKVLGLGLKKYPLFNGTYLNGQYTALQEINIGIITSLREGGLIAPAINDVDSKPIDQLMIEFIDLLGRVKDGKIKRKEMESSTICLTNLGDRGSDQVFGVIYPPQVAIVGIGAINQKVIKQNNQFTEIPVCNWTLSVDHRVTDGHQGSLFLNYLQKLLEKPETWGEQ